MAEALLKKEDAKLESSDEEVMRFDVDNEVLSLNNNLRLLVIIDIESAKIDVNNEEQIEAEQRDESVIKVVFSDDAQDEGSGRGNIDPIIRNVQLVSKNPKFQREYLHKIGILKRSYENKVPNVHATNLSLKNQLIVDELLDKKINYAELVNLFADPIFGNQVSIIKSKSGCVVSAKNYKTLDYVVASTHKKHNKTYDGLNPFFTRDLIKIMALFSIVINPL